MKKVAGTLCFNRTSSRFEVCGSLGPSSKVRAICLAPRGREQNVRPNHWLLGAMEWYPAATAAAATVNAGKSIRTILEEAARKVAVETSDPFLLTGCQQIEHWLQPVR